MMRFAKIEKIAASVGPGCGNRAGAKRRSGGHFKGCVCFGANAQRLGNAGPRYERFCVHGRQAAAVRTFLRFFGFGVLAFEVGESHVERFMSEAASGRSSPQLEPTSGWPTNRSESQQPQIRFSKTQGNNKRM